METTNPDGSVTAYGFACGHLEVYGNWIGGDGVRLYQEHGNYVVRGTSQGDRVWHVLPTLKKARAFARTYGPLQA